MQEKQNVSSNTVSTTDPEEPSFNCSLSKYCPISDAILSTIAVSGRVRDTSTQEAIEINRLE
jgi:hypothetical protein